ncbi:type VI secretion system lipoprotein TssJ [Helicobacter sp. MIT 05-5294]|uniref:type VI secretion system lipoprotein TssJ n=1 Tax=Helicobacter sp. MIT 05-5294 TaxID=1548150 RepID=UPI0010FD4B86|nr:type VI secretion system lipoprotein TssJ [Helicobacter sp. MIT 05-5294]TLD86759.1 type VI secretion system lipoprotein TssJ [Helicobacter sp. MIT 05-5294]
MSKIIFPFVVALLLSACSSMVNVKVNNIEGSNLNNREDDVPLTIIVYQLNDIKKFESASDLDLATREDAILGKDKIDSIRIQIAPQDEVIAVKVDDEEVQYIGLMALFANSAKKTTKAWVKTEDASGFWFAEKRIEFEITKEGVKTNR